MKLHTERSDVERGNIGTETQFQIKTTAKAFDILSSGLYTDNILAIVRELSSNAYDAHVDAGKANTPFEIHLPSPLEPWFHIKDFGTGLSDDDVMNLYSTYFDSTKTESNDLIGALGLGSKSPFSYTTAFEVISRHNGKRRLYSVFLNEDGVPSIARMGEAETDELNGLEIKITVNRKDFYSFANRTRTALKWFPVKPTIVGDSNFQFEPIPEAKVSGENWIFTEKTGYGSSLRITAVQGNVSYNVNASQLNLDESTEQLLEKGHLIAFFEIGEFDFAASREEIRYDPRSIKALEQRLTSFRDKVMKDIEEKADEMRDSDWHAIIQLNKLSRKIFEKEDRLREFIRKAGTNHPVLKMYVETKGMLELPKERPGYEMYFYNRGRSNNLKRTDAGNTVKPSSDLAVFVNDLKTGGVARLNEFINQSPTFDRALVVVRVDNAIRLKEIDGKLEKIKVTEKEYENSYQAITESLKNPGIKIVSEHTPRVKRTPVDRSLPIYTFSGIETTYSSRWRTYNRTTPRLVWDKVNFDEFDIDEGGLYFTLRHRSKIVAPVNGAEKEVMWKPRLVENRFESMIELINKHYPDLDDFSIEKLYGVGVTAQRKVEKMDNWFNLFDLFFPLIHQYHEAVLYHQSINLTPDVCGIMDLVLRNNSTFETQVRRLEPGSPFRQKIEPLIDAHKKNENTSNTAAFVQELDREFFSRKHFDGIGAPFFEEEDLEQYPMLKYVGRIPTYGMDDIFNYIETIDRSRQ